MLFDAIFLMIVFIMIFTFLCTFRSHTGARI